MSGPPFPAQCQKHSDTRPNVVLSDASGGSSEYRAKNPRRRRVTVFCVDGCCIKNREACDFLMLADDNEAWLIELKGRDVAKAIQQIHATLDQFEHALRPRTIHARVVPTRVPAPRIIASDEMKLRKRLGGKDRYKCQARVLEETI